MQHKRFDQMACGIAQALEYIGDWWTLLIIREALFGTETFDGFCNNLGIARNTLTCRLNDLVKRGILQRIVDPEDKRRKTYHLTEAGKELWVILAALQQWGNKWSCSEQGAPSFMAERTTQQPIALVKVYNQQGKSLALEEITIIPGPGATPLLKEKLKHLSIRLNDDSIDRE